jgi:drug/metabolite transporter (DMT)-like permease
MKPADLAAYLFLAVVWGLSFIVIVETAEAFGWVAAVSFRAFIAAATLGLIAAAARRPIAIDGRWRDCVVVGATTVAGQLIGLSYAAPRIGTATTAILVASIPLFSMVIARAFGLERITPQRLAGLALGVAGIVMLVGFPAEPVTVSFLVGCASALAGSLASGFGNVWAARTLRGVRPFDVTAAAFLAGGLITLPLVAAVPVPRAPVPMDFVYLVVAGSVMSALTYVNYFRLVASIGATRAISVEFAVTVVAVFVGAVLLDEPIAALQVAGAAVVILGCALVLGLVGGGRRETAPDRA